MPKRRFPRYPANFRLRLQLPGGELETTTEEISAGGFSAVCADKPPIGTMFGFVVHLPDGRMISGSATVVRSAADGVAGFTTQLTASRSRSTRVRSPTSPTSARSPGSSTSRV